MSDVLSTLRTLVGRVTQRPADRLESESRLAGLVGWGSLAAMHLLAAVEQTYRVQLDLRSYMRFETVGELAAEISNLLAAAPPEDAG
jgi:acyl carrier protein